MTNPGSTLHRKKSESDDLVDNGAVDPLADLFQIDDVQSTQLERETLVLVTRLLQNVEEYYELQGQIMEVMTVDRTLEARFKSLLDSLIQGLSVEKEFLGKEFMNLGASL